MEGENHKEFSSVFTALDYLRRFPLGALYHDDLPSQDSFLMLSRDDVIYYAAERSVMASEVIEVLTDKDINEMFYRLGSGWFYRCRAEFSQFIGGVSFFDDLRTMGQGSLTA